jgi:hypothetical protein
VFVLDQVGDELDVTGSVTGIKNGEQLRSARFVGDHAYLVTFHRVDPLLTVNLSDPAKPRVAGELTIPGFSSYLQPIGEGLLLGLGHDVDPDTQADRGLQLSLFDVSTTPSPCVSTRSSSPTSGKAAKPKATTTPSPTSPTSRSLALPVNPLQRDRRQRHLQLVTGAVVLHIDPTKGADAITKLGEPVPPGGVRRSVRIGDVLYAVGPDQIQAMVLQTPEQVLGSVKLSG